MPQSQTAANPRQQKEEKNDKKKKKKNNTYKANKQVHEKYTVQLPLPPSEVI